MEEGLSHDVSGIKFGDPAKSGAYLPASAITEIKESDPEMYQQIYEQLPANMPSITIDGGTITGNIPQWFRDSPEYESQWVPMVSYYSQLPINQVNTDNLIEFSNALGQQAFIRYDVASNAGNFNISDPVAIKMYTDNYINGIIGEGEIVYGDQIYANAAALGDQIKQMNKVDLSDMMTNLYNHMENAQAGKYETDTPEFQKVLAESISVAQVINYLDDNSPEYKGILQADSGQKTQEFFRSNVEGVIKGVAGIPARILWAVTGGNFDLSDMPTLQQRSGTGQSLEGTEAAARAGAILSSGQNIAVTFALGAMLPNAQAIGSGIGALGRTAAADMLLNDLPMNILYAITDDNPDINKRIEDFGKNMVSDAAVNVALMGLGYGSTAQGRKLLNDITGNRYGKVNDYVSSKILKGQLVAGKIPGINQMLDAITGSETRELIRLAKKATVSSGDNFYLKNMYNLINEVGSKGASTIGAYLKNNPDHKAWEDAIVNLRKRTDLGEIGKTRVPFIDSSGREKFEMVDNTIPADVRRAIFDSDETQRIRARMKTDMASVTADEKVYLREAEARLSEIDGEVMSFVRMNSDHDKAFQAFLVENGITNADQYDAWLGQELFGNYAHRRAVVYPRSGGGDLPGTSGELTRGRTNTLSWDMYLDPTQSFWTKADAAGRAIAKNDLTRFTDEVGRVTGVVNSADAINELTDAVSNAYRSLDDSVSVKKALGINNINNIMNESKFKTVLDSKLKSLDTKVKASEISAQLNEIISGSINRLAKELPSDIDTDIAKAYLYRSDDVKNTILERVTPHLDDDFAKTKSYVDKHFRAQLRGYEAFSNLPEDEKRLRREVSSLEKKLSKAVSDFDSADGTLIPFFENGKERYIQFNDPVVARSLAYDYKKSMMDPTQLARLASKINQTYRVGTTGLNPVSWIRNILRDPATAFITSGFNPAGSMMNPLEIYKMTSMFGTDQRVIDDVIAQIDTLAGGSTYTSMLRRNSQTTPGKIAKEINNQGIKAKILKASTAVPDTMEALWRKSAGKDEFIKTMIRTNGNVDKATAAAMLTVANSTTNFNNTIEAFRDFNRTVPYLQSAINGTISFSRMASLDPVGVAARIGAGGVIPVMKITMQNLGTEKKLAAYEKLTEEQKEGFLPIIDDEGNVFLYPLPQEIQPFVNITRQLIEKTYEINPDSIGSMFVNNALGFTPFDFSGFDLGGENINWEKGFTKIISGISPQAAQAFYEYVYQKDMYTGQDLAGYSRLNQNINLITNIFGSGTKNLINSVGEMLGIPEETFVGKTFQDELANDLFGIGSDATLNTFMEVVGAPDSVEPNGVVIPATGLFKERNDIMAKVKALDSQRPYALDPTVIDQQKKAIIDDFGNKVATAMEKYSMMFQMTGGLKQWQKNRLVNLLMIGDFTDSAVPNSWQSDTGDEAYFAERGLAQERYQSLGLPSGSTVEADDSIDLQVARNKIYGAPKAMKKEFDTLVKDSNIKGLRQQFYNNIDAVYDAASAAGEEPNYEMIARLQSQFLQAFDATLVPILSKYGIATLNNNDFVNEVRSLINGMIPSDDWRQSTKNAKRFLSTKEFPTTAVDVEKWLKQRYTTSLQARNLPSDEYVVSQLNSIKQSLDSGRTPQGKALARNLRGKIDNAEYYISTQDRALLDRYLLQ